MKYQDAMEIIRKNEKRPRLSKKPNEGFMVSFEKRMGGVLASHHFPDKHGGEPLIKTEEEAWRLANRFASATGNDIVNIYVVDSQWSPVKDYNLKRIRKY